MSTELLGQPEKHDLHFRNSVVAALVDILWGMNGEDVLFYRGYQFILVTQENFFVQPFHCSELYIDLNRPTSLV